MRQLEEVTCGIQGAERLEDRLDLVVPFTTPNLTFAALQAANRLAVGLAPVIRLLKIQLVPYPLDLSEPPIPISFLEKQLARLPSDLPVNCEIRLARDFETGLMSALRKESLVLLATRRRPWKTSAERLAAFLGRAGYKVLMVSENRKDNNA